MSESTFIIHGNKPLHGEIVISGSKNAVLPIIAGALLIPEEVILHNVPRIEDVFSMIELIEYLGVKTAFEGNTLRINAEHLEYKPLTQRLVKKFRASILLLSPVLVRTGKAEMIFPGGCLLGRRSIRAHINCFRDFETAIESDIDILKLQLSSLTGHTITMWEPSVTASENAITLSVFAKGTSNLRLVAMEPHIQDLCNFYNAMGAHINGVGTTFLDFEGVNSLHGGEYTVTSDYLETGTYAIAGSLIEGSHITLTNTHPDQLDSLWNKLREVGVRFTLHETYVEIFGGGNFEGLSKLDTRLYPYFPTDLQAPFSVLLTQAHGESRIFETLFEGRLNYLYELEKMGAKMEILNPHQATIYGPTKLKGTTVASCDIRAGAAVVLAALCAEGETEITNIDYIDRGYENLEDKLSNVGADIKRL